MTLVSLLDHPFFVAAGGPLPPLVQDIGVCILTAGFLAILFAKLRIPTIAAFLLAGIIVGPQGVQAVTDQANIETIANLGLILLLFLIGLEIDLRKLLASGRTLIVTGLLQFPLCVLLGYGVVMLLVSLGVGTELLGGAGGGPSYVPLYIGFVTAASSTLLVVKLFQEQFQLDTTVGRVSLGILIFQDIWAIVVIAVQPNFADPQVVPILMGFLGIALLIGLSVLLAKHVLPIGFRWIAKLPELVLVGAVAWCFAIGFLGQSLDSITMALAGVNLHLAVSMEMGALIAGASIASLPYSTEVISEVGTVKNFFVTLFFVGLGMGIPQPRGADVLLLAIFVAGLSIAARFLVFFPLLYWTGLYRRNAMVASVRLAQVSEFSLVIAYVGVALGHLSEHLNATIIFAFVITALLTPLLFNQADAAHELLGPVLDRIGFRGPTDADREEAVDEYAIAFLGFHRVASSLLFEIGRTEPALLKEILVVDFNVNIHGDIAARGPTVKYGDFSNSATLHHAGIDKAKVLVCTIPNDVLKGTTTRKLVESLRHINPGATIIVNALEFGEAEGLYAAGADYVYLPRIESARLLLAAILRGLRGEIDTHRAEHEAQHGPVHKRGEVFG